MIALVDCNNFYASCEGIFNPKIVNKPVVVLSNNDGCVVARSKLAKKYIPMGAPIFKYKNEVELHNIYTFSANFSLYGDISNRVMQILKEFSSNVEVYSIDEAFLDFNNTDKLKIYKICQEIRLKIFKCLGIYVSIGIAPTKTLAKICNHYAKDNEFTKGVFLWDFVENKDNFLKKLPVENIWNIGYKSAIKLNENGIYTALDFKNANSVFIRKLLSVTGLRVQSEIQQIKCFGVDSFIHPKKGILSSRSFGKPVTELNDLEEAVSTYITRAWEKLMNQNMACNYVYVSIKTNKFKNTPQYFNYKIESLSVTTWDLSELISTGKKILKSIYKKGYFYKKATVMLLGITTKDSINLNILNSNYNYLKCNNLMNAILKINKEEGGDFIRFASNGINQSWKMKSGNRSNRFTTSWNELLTVK